MLGITHAAVGACIGAALGGPSGSFVGALSALVPDIDEPNSTLGRKAPLISTLTNLLLGHRGLTHTLLFSALTAAAVWAAFGQHFGLIWLAGCLSHIALDCCTLSGCMPFEPVSKKRIHGRLKTGTIPDMAVGLLALVFLLVRLK